MNSARELWGRPPGAFWFFSPLCVTPRGFLHVAYEIITNCLKPPISLISTSLFSYNVLLGNRCLLAIVSLCYLFQRTVLCLFLSCRRWQHHRMLLRWLHDATVRLIFKTFSSATLGGSRCSIVTNSRWSIKRNVGLRVGLQPTILQKQSQEITTRGSKCLSSLCFLANCQRGRSQLLRAAADSWPHCPPWLS